MTPSSYRNDVSSVLAEAFGCDLRLAIWLSEPGHTARLVTCGPTPYVLIGETLEGLGALLPRGTDAQRAAARGSVGLG